MTSSVAWGRDYDPFYWDPFDIGGGWPLYDTGRRGRGSEEGGGGAVARTSVDWCETPNAHIFRADIPGLKREDVKVHVEEGNILEISGERTKEEEEEEATDTWHRRERRRVNFRRRFRLPENAVMDDVQCSMDHGVLTVTVPKEAPGGAQRKIRAIEIS